ncbi:MAG: riboflavin synthase [Bacteroidota bacterium]|nr:riboflavin synthase [Bacteroidota bacterium]
MFTGIIESIGVIKKITPNQNNLDIEVTSDFTAELKIDQSVAHNGICLTVVSINNDSYTVTAIEETINKTAITSWKEGHLVNLERGLRLGDRLDGHIVQGHVDQTATCTAINTLEGSTIYTFEYDSKLGNITIEKGSITINGVSLTIINSTKNQFSVAIIPYTFENTTFKNLNIGDLVNIEFDVIGKYVSQLYRTNR